MTGRELVAWIKENNAYDMEVLFLLDDGTVARISPEVKDNKDVKAEYWEGGFLPDDGRSVIL